jgi:hypothetical protein
MELYNPEMDLPGQAIAIGGHAEGKKRHIKLDVLNLFFFPK